MPTRGLSQTFPSLQSGLAAGTKLNAGGSLPWLGFGVWQIRGDGETERAVRTALDLGYRSIDTAMLYGNERGVGQAIRDSGVPREQVFVTTKVWNDDVRAGRVEAAFEQSLKQLDLGYVDLYLVHWPITGKIASTWKAMEKLLATGRVKAIGVSNHARPHLDELLAVADVVPAVNQLEYHPYLQSKALVEFCLEKGIRPEAWSPLMAGGSVLNDPTIAAIARKHGKSVAQVILRWEIQGGVVTIPKTVHAARMKENASVFDFALTEDEMKAIDALDRNERSGADPMNFGF